jgi:hypothetical protein
VSSLARRAAFLLLLALFLVPDRGLAKERRVLKLRFPTIRVTPGGTSEGCVFVHVPNLSAFDLAHWEIRNQSRGMAVLHSIVYLYRGERLDEFASGAGRVVLSRGCLDLGPADRDQRQMIAAITSTRGQGDMPPGVALRLAAAPGSPGGAPAGLGFVLDINWSNSGSRPRKASARVILRRPRRGTVRRLAQPFDDRSPELGLSVAPFMVGSTETSTATLNAQRPGEPAVRDAWAPAADACVVTMAPRLHKRARFFGVDLLDANGAAQNPQPGTRNPFEPDRTPHLYGALDFTDPGLRVFRPPLLVRAGEALHYLCYHDNGTTRAVRFGCDEVGSSPPGRAEGRPGGGPAKPCATPGATSSDCPAADPAFPGRSFTGACIPANLVAGPTPDDETCALTGVVFDAANGQCDVGSLPPIE